MIIPRRAAVRLQSCLSMAKASRCRAKGRISYKQGSSQCHCGLRLLPLDKSNRAIWRARAWCHSALLSFQFHTLLLIQKTPGIAGGVRGCDFLRKSQLEGRGSGKRPKEKCFRSWVGRRVGFRSRGDGGATAGFAPGGARLATEAQRPIPVILRERNWSAPAAAKRSIAAGTKRLFPVCWDLYGWSGRTIIATRATVDSVRGIELCGWNRSP
jgi:hypothetical protein